MTAPTQPHPATPASTPSAPAQAHKSESIVWLLSQGDDGIGSQLVTGWTALRRAWLDNHRSFVDHDNLSPEDLETLALLEDDDNWKHDDVGARFSLYVNYEGDWIDVTRVDGSAAISQPAASQDATPASAEAELRRLLQAAVTLFACRCGDATAMNWLADSEAALAAQPAAQQVDGKGGDDRLPDGYQWCLSCGEGVTSVCRGKGITCPLGKPASPQAKEGGEA